VWFNRPSVLGSIADAIGINHVLTDRLGNAIDNALAPAKVRVRQLRVRQADESLTNKLIWA
jgi:hypothetical protein